MINIIIKITYIFVNLQNQTHIIMKIHLRFLLIFAYSLLFFTNYAPLIAKENLNKKIKNIAKSVVILYAYDDTGKQIAEESGFFISKDGDVITNREVLIGATNVKVKTASGEVYTVIGIVAEDEDANLLRIKVDIPPKNVRPISLSTNLPELDDSIVVYSPFGTKKNAPKSIVLFVKDTPEFGKVFIIKNALFTNSNGCPVINMNGDVIGISMFPLFDKINGNVVVSSERIAGLKITDLIRFSEWLKPTSKTELLSAKELYKKGQEWLEHNDFKNALYYFKKVIEKDPDYPNAYFKIGYCNGRLDSNENAIEAYKQAVRINPDYGDAYFNLGNAYDKIGCYVEAIDAYKQVLRINPKDAEACNFLGISYLNLSRYPEAIDAYKNSISIDPNYVIAYYNLGFAYNKMGLFPESIDAYKQAINIKPNDAQAYYQLGLTYDNLAHYTEAIDAYKKAILSKPDYAEAYNGLAGSYSRLGRLDEAIETFKQCIRIKPESEVAHFNLGLVYGRLHRFEDGIVEFQKAASINPKFADAYFGLGLFYNALKRPNKAIDAYKEVLRLKPDDPEVHYELGKAYLLSWDKISAMKEYNILKDLDKELANQLLDFINK
jgi:tetratricopeptide (TPR) repeat protein